MRCSSGFAEGEGRDGVEERWECVGDCITDPTATRRPQFWISGVKARWTCEVSEHLSLGDASWPGIGES